MQVVRRLPRPLHGVGAAVRIFKKLLPLQEQNGNRAHGEGGGRGGTYWFLKGSPTTIEGGYWGQRNRCLI